MAEIFVSYARNDLELVKQIMLELHHLGLEYWIDVRNLRGGDVFTEEIAHAILECDTFLLVMSGASMNSEYVSKELQLASNHKKTIVLLRIDNAAIPPKFELLLSGIQWIEYSAPDWKERLTLALQGRSIVSRMENVEDQRRDAYLPKAPKHMGYAAAIAILVIMLGTSVYYFVRPQKCVYTGAAKTDAEAIHWLIEAEAQAAVAADLNLIKDIFAVDAIIIDYGDRNLPVKWNNPIDRYQPLFEAYQFISLQNDHIMARRPIQGETAYYVSGSHGSYQHDGQTIPLQNPDDASHWTVTKIAGCWKITKFEFNASGISFPE